MTTVVPGHWLGVMGGGQLGRMFCQAAQAMGYRVLVLDPDDQAPACQIADEVIQANYDDDHALSMMAHRCSAVTTEFENVPAASLAALARRVRVTPGASAVEVAQDRCVEKAFIESLGIPVAPHAKILTVEDLDQVSPALLKDGILKSARLGYDGKGQCRVTDLASAVAGFKAMGEVSCVLEARLDLAYEVSVVLARSVTGEVVTYDVARNIHHDGILSVTHVDGKRDDVCTKATKWATEIANGLGYHGVLCVEFFVLSDGRLFANEIAPRPHNSGHYTQNACVTSQFEQQVRVMAELPLGSTRLLAPTVMLNLLGEVWLRGPDGNYQDPDWRSVLGYPEVSLHLYGKNEARVGRKMGHINITADTMDKAISVANQIVAQLDLPDRATLQ